jgi:hypothetical protein
MLTRKIVASCLSFLCMAGTKMALGTTEIDTANQSDRESPWLFVPLVSSDPKLGTSAGALAAYLHRFDEKSSVSMFGAGGVYTTTHSTVGALFARTFFGEDRHRLFAVAASGKINNDYSDYLNTGYPVQSQDDLRAFYTRYTYQVRPSWFVGVQLADTNYAQIAQDAMSEQILQLAGLTGFDSIGLGLVVDYDTRDNVNTPTSGIFADGNSLAYTKKFGGDVSFQAYRFMLKQYLPHHKGKNVFAWKINNHWTSNAPPSGYASISLRGYTVGQYLGPNMSSIEAEERIGMGKRWGFTAFTGIACLYGNGMQCNSNENLYPDVGAGMYYILKPKDKIAATVEFADGKGPNNGFYMRLGWGF